MTAPFASRLVAWHAAHGRQDLPWQNTRDPYRVWLSEIMLQQTQVATVVPYYQRFLASFPEVRALAAAPLERVLEHWSGLGYYRRAHHLHAAARVVVDVHGGVFPGDVAALAALPGVGRSTAAAIAAFSFSARAAILDGNVKRVLARHRGIEGYPGAAKVEAALWQSAESLLPADAIEIYTQALMDLGATVCTRTGPQCDRCPAAGDCIARRDGRVALLPTPRPAKVLPRRALRVLLLEHVGNLLLEKRPSAGIWGGLWSLPEMPLDQDVAVHCRARFDAQVTVQEALPPIDHGFTHYRLTLHPQRVAVQRWPARVEAPGYAWLLPGDALAAALPAPIRKLLRDLAAAATAARKTRVPRAGGPRPR
jgi:A/G-specific adenine glycosylase